jgi:hypothetical protein
MQLNKDTLTEHYFFISTINMVQMQLSSFLKVILRVMQVVSSGFAERILAVAETCRRQGIKLMEFLVDAIKAGMIGKSMPSLVSAHTG